MCYKSPKHAVKKHDTLHFKTCFGASLECFLYIEQPIQVSAFCMTSRNSPKCTKVTPVETRVPATLRCEPRLRDLKTKWVLQSISIYTTFFFGQAVQDNKIHVIINLSHFQLTFSYLLKDFV